MNQRDGIYLDVWVADTGPRWVRVTFVRWIAVAIAFGSVGYAVGSMTGITIAVMVVSAAAVIAGYRAD